MIKGILYKLFSKLAIRFFKKDITGKPILGYKKKLFFEKSQHLGFLNQKNIRYEHTVQEKIVKYINKDAIIFDIGSNIGQYALIFSELVGEEGKVICFEPDYNNFTFLTFNKLKNRCHNIETNNKGLGAQSTKLKFYKDAKTGGRTSSFKKEYVKGNQIFEDTNEVVVSTLDIEIEKHGIPNFVKIDVEGFEDEIIKGLTKDLDQTVFFIEVRKETKKTVFKYFSERGYICKNLDLSIEKIIANESEIEGFANLLFERKKN